MVMRMSEEQSVQTSLCVVKTREEQSCYGAQSSAYNYGAPCLGLKKTCRLHANRINDLVNHNTGNGWAVEELPDWFEDNIQQVRPATRSP